MRKDRRRIIMLLLLIRIVNAGVANQSHNPCIIKRTADIKLEK
jgi:hypothetical protein